MDVRISNDKGTIEISHAERREVAALFSALTKKVLGVTLSEVEIEVVRSGDCRAQVEREEVPTK